MSCFVFNLWYEHSYDAFHCKTTEVYCIALCDDHGSQSCPFLPCWFTFRPRACSFFYKWRRVIFLNLLLTLLTACTIATLLKCFTVCLYFYTCLLKFMMKRFLLSFFISNRRRIYLTNKNTKGTSPKTSLHLYLYDVKMCGREVGGWCACMCVCLVGGGGQCIALCVLEDAYSFPDIVSPPLLSVCLVFFPLYCALQNGFGQTRWTN